jgi:hypothetical protein
MAERAFVIMQVGKSDSPERKRADEIYNFIIAPAVRDANLEPYRADQDLTPGAITPKFLSELLSARVIIADLTGRNPNVFYELGIAHSFARPLISIADSSSSLPFDTKDERVIELGEYPPTGLTYAQGERAKASLQESLIIVLSDGYVSPSPLREVAANASVDQLAPENPLAAEMAQIRESLEELRRQPLPAADPPYYEILEEILMRSRRMDRELAGFALARNSSESDAPLFARAPSDQAPMRRADAGDLSRLLVSDLQRIAQELGIRETGRMRKGDLVRAIQERTGGKP